MKSKALGLLFFIFIMLVGYIYSEYDVRQGKKVIDQINIEFPAMQKTRNLNNKVKEIYCPPRFNCSGFASRVILDDNKKISMYAEHDLSGTIRLLQILNVGDSISKTAGSDTIFVFNNNEKREVHKFILSYPSESVKK